MITIIDNLLIQDGFWDNMARPVDIKKKIEELRDYLIKYNGIPKQTENHAAHKNILYYIKNILITKTYAKNFEFLFAVLPAIDGDG